MDTLKLTFKDDKDLKTYEVSQPSVGNFYDIEATKQLLGKGFYKNLVDTNTEAAQQAADMIDIEATLSIMCPDLFKDLKIEGLKDLSFGDYVKIKEVYADQFLPWWDLIRESLKSIK